jgi:hypothetical protein
MINKISLQREVQVHVGNKKILNVLRRRVIGETGAHREPCVHNGFYNGRRLGCLRLL